MSYSHQRLTEGKQPGLPQTERAEDYPRLLFVSDLPPCHLTGGPILVHRLLEGYAMDRLTVACAAGLLPRAAKTLLPCRHVPLFRTNATGRWGWGRLKQLADLVAVGPMVWSLGRLLRETRADAVLTVAHDVMFIPAVLAANRVGKPVVVLVQDDWVWMIGHHAWIPKALAPVIFRRTLMRASHVYAISDGVQQWLRTEFGVDSEVQLPCADAEAFELTPPIDDGVFRIVFTGGYNFSTGAGVRLLVEALRGGAVGDNWTLDLYGASSRDIANEGWEEARVTAHGWGSQKDVHMAMTRADLLFVPFGFSNLARLLATRQFPSKMADYLAARRAILVCAPPESSISRYVHRWDCAELVKEPSGEAMTAALRRLASSPERRRDLVEHGWKAYLANHDAGRLRAELVSRLRALVGRTCAQVEHGCRLSGQA